ncbi:hypothetical protein D7J27_17015, partial [Salmonella enterica]|nr:hypothetical protein [Salmonella enterica]ECA8824456.1 hypothetical protein [Salmonella enterica subsp. enterica serovar Mbandaka]
GGVNIIAPGGAVGWLTKENTTLMPDGGYALSGIWFCVRWKSVGFRLRLTQRVYGLYASQVFISWMQSNI